MHKFHNKVLYNINNMQSLWFSNNIFIIINSNNNNSFIIISINLNNNNNSINNNLLIKINNFKIIINNNKYEINLNNYINKILIINNNNNLITIHINIKILISETITITVQIFNEIKGFTIIIKINLNKIIIITTTKSLNKILTINQIFIKSKKNRQLKVIVFKIVKKRFKNEIKHVYETTPHKKILQKNNKNKF